MPGPSNSRERQEIRVPQRPYIPRNQSDNFVPDCPITCTDSYGRDGIAFADVVTFNENFNDLIGKDGPMLANYAETVIALRLEVSFISPVRRLGRNGD